MKVKTKNVYYCEHCNKHGLSEWQMKRHEILCSRNPINHRPCFNCQHLGKEQTEIYCDNYDGSQSERKLNLFYCHKKKMFLHTPQNEAKGNMFDLCDFENNPMPTECDDYSVSF